MDTYREALAKLLTKSERGELARGYELLGSIAIVELSAKLRKKERRIAQALMGSNPRIKTVLAKAGPISGVYRIRRLRHIAGARNYIATCRENGCTFVFDVRKVYFSSKLSYERNRVSQQVKNGENVIVMFAGVGPFVIEIAKAHQRSTVVGIELNRSAYGYMGKNIKLNKVPNASAVFGDVKKVYRKYLNFADRVIMPLPASSLKFMDQALAVAKRSATIYIYVLGRGDSVLAESWKAIAERARAKGYSAKMLGHRTVRPYSAKELEIAIDYQVRRHG